MPVKWLLTIFFVAHIVLVRMSQIFSGKRNIITFLLIAATLLVLVYTSSNPYENKQETIRIGINQWPGYEYLFIAEKQGFFKQEKLDVELVELSTLAGVRRAFERGKLDGMAATLIEVMEAYKYSGRIAQPVLITDYSNGADQILGSTHLKSIKDIKGKKIGVEAGSLSTYLVNYALNTNNIKSSEVIMVPLDTHKFVNALKNRRVDAITSYPPASIALKKEFNLNILFDSSLIPHKLLDIVAIDRDILIKHPKFQNKLLRVWELTLSYVDKHPLEAFEILTERFQISKNEFQQSLASIHLIPAHEQDRYFNKEGLLKKSLIKTGEIVFKHLDREKIDYSMFIYDGYSIQEY